MISVGWFLAFTRIIRLGFRGFLENGISFGFGSRAMSISFTNGFGFKKDFQKLNHVGCVVGSNYFDQLF
jgi:hypothetical protein